MTLSTRADLSNSLSYDWKRMKLWGISHAINDLYQGLTPAVMPFFMLERGYDYTTSASLILALTLGSSIPQPLFGILVDRNFLPWMAPLGILLAGIGFGFSGITPTYTLLWLMLFISGIGIAMYHPGAGKAARFRAENSTFAMSIFATGGSIGFSLAPLLAAPLFIQMGQSASIIFLLPALIMAWILWKKSIPKQSITMNVSPHYHKNQWGSFIILTLAEIIRSCIFIGINTFIALWWIHHLHSNTAVGEIALALFLIGGVIGTIAGGQWGDRIGLILVVRYGSMLAFPPLVILYFISQPYLDLFIALIIGICVNIPFAVLVKLGQDYLPQYPGTAAGITLGIAVSIGGLCTPLLGALADKYGIHSAFLVLMFIPLISSTLSFFLRSPLASG